MTHWVEQYLGKPWKSGARGPDAFDCWGFLVWVYEHHYNISLPHHPGVDPMDCLRTGRLMEAAVKGPDWREIQSPVDGCAVGMSRNKILHHVGIYLQVDKGVVAHAHEDSFVIAQPLSSLRISGWPLIRYFLHKDYHGSDR